jgi:hypothetical protein
MKKLIWKKPQGIKDKKHPFYDLYLILNTVAENCHGGAEMTSFTGFVSVPLSQGGIRRDGIDYPLKMDFKGYFPMFYAELPQMPRVRSQSRQPYDD